MLPDVRNLWLDLIRALSAMLVCMGHLRNALLLDMAKLEHANVLLKAFYAITSFGHQAVMVFFVLSGYFVGGAVLRAGSNFSWQSYLISRFTRLWVVLIPSLILTWFVGQVLWHCAPNVLAGAYAESWHSGPKPHEYSTSFITLLGNVFFLQTISVPVFGVNGPLWSLANEFWYYLLFPLVMVACGVVGSAQSMLRLMAAIIAVALALYLPSTLLFGFLIWLLGFAVYCLQAAVKRLSSAKVYVGLFAAFIMFAGALAYTKTAASMYLADALVGTTFALLCLMFTRLSFPKVRLPWLAKAALYGSEISYSLYLSHFPVVILIAALVYKSQKSVPTVFSLAEFFGWFGLLVGVGFVMWQLFESHTPMVRKRLSAWLNVNMAKN